jgi:uncharacterized protein YdaU (DUF1376 family)
MATPWFPMYPTDFLVSTATMSPVQGWAYTQLLMYAWTNGGIPDDREQCAALTRCPLSEADWAVLRARFEPMATPMATLCNPRMERERERVKERHDAASEAGRRGAKARWERGNGVANGHPNGHPNGETIATTTTTTTTKNPTPTPPRRTGAGVVDIKDSELKRLVMREPAWRTRIERAEAGDWFDEDKRPIEPAAILATAMNTVRERTINERDTIIERVTAKGLSDGEAAQLWRAWFVEHMNGGPAPGTAMRNDLNDKSIRNHASVWRARLGGKYTPDHGEVTKGSGAAGGDG